MRWRLQRLLEIFRSAPIAPPQSIEQYTPTDAEIAWARRVSESKVRRIRELGVSVDLKRVEHGT